MANTCHLIIILAIFFSLIDHMEFMSKGKNRLLIIKKFEKPNIVLSYSKIPL